MGYYEVPKLTISHIENENINIEVHYMICNKFIVVYKSERRGLGRGGGSQICAFLTRVISYPGNTKHLYNILYNV